MREEGKLAMAIAVGQPLISDGIRTRRRVWGRRLEFAAGLCGGALAVLVGTDGSPVWQAVRVLAVAAITALLIAALLRSPSRWRGRLAVGAGIPAIAIAVGFAPHLAKGGPAATTAAAIVLAVAGIALTAGGAVIATRARRWWEAGSGTWRAYCHRSSCYGRRPGRRRNECAAPRTRRDPGTRRA